MRGLRSARCWWPLEDIYLTTKDAYRLARMGIGDICDDNGWVYLDDTARDWSIDEVGGDEIVVSCVIDVRVVTEMVA